MSRMRCPLRTGPTHEAHVPRWFPWGLLMRTAHRYCKRVSASCDARENARVAEAFARLVPFPSIEQVGCHNSRPLRRLGASGLGWAHVEEAVDFREILRNIYRPGKKEMVRPSEEHS